MSNAELAALADRVEAISHVIHCIADEAEDEGDRVYFGSTNDPHRLARQAQQLLGHAEKLRALAALEKDQDHGR